MKHLIIPIAILILASCTKEDISTPIELESQKRTVVEPIYLKDSLNTITPFKNSDIESAPINKDEIKDSDI